MGRETKRVSMDFAWPMKQTWEGFLNPFYKHCAKCAACGGSGYSPQAKFLSEQWYGSMYGIGFQPRSTGSTPYTPDHPAVRAFVERQVNRNPEFYGTGEAAILREGKRLCGRWNGDWCHHLDAADVAALLKANRLTDLTRGKPEGYVPSPQEVNDWSLADFGHDAINQWVCVKAKAKRLRYPKSCAVCAGKGDIWDSPENERSAEEWSSYEPPAGDGWQMWETTSEGSPISPVFASPEELAKWLADTGASSFGSYTATYDQWLGMIGVGWAPSMIASSAGVQSGVAAVSGAA